MATLNAPCSASGLKDLRTTADAIFLLRRERVATAEDIVVVGREDECGSKTVGQANGRLRTLPVTHNHELVTSVTEAGHASGGRTR